ncbi:MAG: transporter substrate-binding domain-containing protein [Pseudomonadota bacterium]
MQHGLSRPLLAALCAAALHLPARAGAGCSRPIIVPAAPTGQTVYFSGAEAQGLIPDMLSQIGARIGCTFKWSMVPRARLETMFESGSADLLVAATRVDRRDKAGVFVPMLEARPTLISLASERAPVRNFAELLERRELRVALVRGYDYGDAYQALAKALASQGRLYLEPDAVTIARLINGGMADVTIMPASAFIGATFGDPRVEGMAANLRTEALDELPWIRTGIYLSRKSLTSHDRALLEKALTASVKTGAWWQALKRYYPPEVLKLHARPLENAR